MLRHDKRNDPFFDKPRSLRIVFIIWLAIVAVLVLIIVYPLCTDVQAVQAEQVVEIRHVYEAVFVTNQMPTFIANVSAYTHSMADCGKTDADRKSVV